MAKYIIPAIDLQLFSEGGAAPAGSASGEGSAAVNAEVAAPQAQSKKGVKANPLANVVYGKQEAPAAEAQNTGTEETAPDTTKAVNDRRAAFDSLIKGEYKDLYDERVQDTVQKRLRGSKETVDKYNALTPTLELLAKKYGVDPTDTEALKKAIAEDDSYYEKEAMDKGISVQQLKEIRRIESENADLKRRVDEAARREASEKIYSAWLDQAEGTKQYYPEFDLRGELQNPEFAKLLRAGVDVKSAFEVIHKDEIIPAAMQYTARQVEAQVVNKIQAAGARPVENGNSGASGPLVKSDVSKLTKADRDEIIKRVAGGERIVF